MVEILVDAIKIGAGFGVLVACCLAAANPPGHHHGGFLALTVVVGLVFLLHQALILQQRAPQRVVGAVGAIWIWLLCLALSLGSSPGRRHHLLSEPGHLKSGPDGCVESATVLWITAVLLPSSLWLPMQSMGFALLGQAIALQHLVIGISLPLDQCAASEAGFGGVLLGLPPVVVPAIQLHLIALMLAFVHHREELDRLVCVAAEDFSESLEGMSEPEFGRQVSNEIKTPLEKLAEGFDQSVSLCADFLEKVDFSRASPAHYAWLQTMDAMLEQLTMYANGIKQVGNTAQMAKRVFTEPVELQGEVGEHSGKVVELFGGIAVQAVDLKKDESWPPEDKSQVFLDLPQGNSQKSPQQLQPQDMPASESELSVLGASQVQDVRPLANDLDFDPAVAQQVGVGTWDLDTLAVADSHGNVLTIVGYELLSPHEFLIKDTILPFLERLHGGYKANPYHSATHAADVANACLWLTRSCGLMELAGLTDRKVAGMVVAALGHDVGHPGFNNNFMINSRHRHALTYSDRSVLEGYHCAELMRLLSLEYGDEVRRVPLANFSLEQLREDRAWMTSLILLTDMSKHIPDLGAFRLRLGGENWDPINDPGDQEMVLSWFFRASDIGHAAKRWDLHQVWSVRVAQEFHAQGEEEMRLGLPISPLCDKKGFNCAKSQAGFLQFICLPLFTELKNFEEKLLLASETASASENASVDRCKSDMPGRKKLMISTAKNNVAGMHLTKVVPLDDNASSRSPREDRMRQMKSTPPERGSGLLGGGRSSMNKSTPAPLPSIPSSASRKIASTVFANCENNYKMWSEMTEEESQAFAKEHLGIVPLSESLP